MRIGSRWLAGAGLLVGLAACSTDRSEAPEARTGRGTFLIMGEPVELQYRVVNGQKLFAGDILLDPDSEIAVPVTGAGQVAQPAFKKGGSLKSYLWPNGVIPYVLSGSVTTPGRVHDAMNEWEKKTAIRFVKRTNQKAYLTIREEAGNTVCSANIGYDGAPKLLKLRDTSKGSACLTSVIVHELGHVVGFQHEHQRSDRDQYVKINWGCVPTGLENNFSVIGGTKIGSYDIVSTMHYRSTTLNKSGCGSYSIKKKNGSLLLHDWTTLSAGDVAATAKLYGPPASDKDADGVPDSSDNCPNDANAGQTDTDGDGKGNACDDDDDNDGVLDVADNCPKNANAGQKDTDGDGKGDACDGDDDNDSIADAKDNCPKNANKGQLDTDKDGAGDACDDDDDGDGVPDATDNCPKVANAGQADADNDGVGNACSVDDDGDGFPDSADNCPKVANPEQEDLDSDGKGDACDDDIDGDGIANDVDPCPETAGDVCLADTDQDGILDSEDNCPTVENPEQTDSDDDGVGDDCADTDGDGAMDVADNCPDVPNEVEPEPTGASSGTIESSGGCALAGGPGGFRAGWLGLVALALLRRRRYRVGS